MPFRAKFSDEQRDALVRAALDFGLSAADAARRAGHGALPGTRPDLPAFSITPEYAAQLVREERQRRGTREAAAMAPEQVMRKTLGMLAVRLEEQVRKMERRAIAPTGEEIRELARAGREVAALARAVHGLPQVGQTPRSEGRNAASVEADRGFIAGLARGESS
jgi:hypothetical protein